jgi:hypothetical protein
LLHGTADVLWPVVAANGARFATPLDDLLKDSDHPLGRQREIDLDAKCLPVEVIDHIQQSETAAVTELIVHEVHGPHLVDCRRHRQRLWFLSNQPLPRLDPQIQVELPVNPVHAFVVPAVAPYVA